MRVYSYFGRFNIVLHGSVGCLFFVHLFSCVLGLHMVIVFFFFFFQAEDGIRDGRVTGVQTCALPICRDARLSSSNSRRAARRSCAPARRRSRALPRLARAETQEPPPPKLLRDQDRSEERRVGKECRSRWSPDHEKKREEK